MWIKTQYGRLVNLRHVYSVRVMMSDAGYWVQGRQIRMNTEPVDITKPADEEQARQAFELIVDSLRRKKLYVEMPGSAPQLPPGS